MPVEAPRGGEQEGQPVDHIGIARSAFADALAAPEYNGVALIGRTLDLQNSLLGGRLAPADVFQELAGAASQAATHADDRGDAGTTSVLEGLQRGYDLSLGFFKDTVDKEAGRKAHSMTAAKGGEPKPEPLKRRRRSPKTP